MMAVKLLTRIKQCFLLSLSMVLFTLPKSVMAMTSADSVIAPTQNKALYGFLGAISNNRHEHDKAWGAEYIQSLGKVPAISISYLNEGHFNHHFRDGIAVQFLARFYPLTHVVLSAGAGPYFYSDTIFYNDKTNYINSQKLALNYSLAVTYSGFNPVLIKLGFNHVQAFNSINTNTFLLGLGYQLGATKTSTLHADVTSKYLNNEITALLGQTTVNSVHNEHSMAYEIEYRRSLMPYLEGSLNWLDEGSNPLYRRNGVAADIWLSHRFFADHIKFAIGLGPYVTFLNRQISKNKTVTKKTLAGLLSVNVDYYINSQWFINGTFNRVVTTYDRNSDMFLLGLGCRF